MAYSVRLVKRAASDRDSILEYLAVSLNSPQMAKAFLDEFDSKVKQLVDNPLSCEACNDLALRFKGYRKALLNSYLFIYLVDEGAQTITIMRIFHQSQDYARYL